MKTVYNLMLVLSILACSLSCTETTEDETLVVTEEIVYVSSEVVRLTGRILSIGSGGLIDHGFMIADNEAFADAVVISLGSKPNPGRFYGESDVLTLETNYYCRTFATTGEGSVLGNTKSFETLIPSLKTYSPLVALPGRQMIITGRNLSVDTKVFFGDKEAQIRELNFESEVIVTIPAIADAFKVRISVESQGQKLHFADSFEYVFGKWDQLNSFPASSHYLETMGFRRGDEFFFGLGKGPSADFNSRIWKLDLANMFWTELFFGGNGVAHPFYDNGFFGTGQSGNCLCSDFIVTNDWYEFDLTGGFFGGEGFVYRGELPFAYYKSRALTMNGVMYVLGGFNSDKTDNFDIWSYDELGGTWFISGKTPFAIDNEYPHFIHDGLAYFITLEGVIWSFDPISNDWNEVGVTPFEAIFSGTSRRGISEVINGKAYIGVFERSPGMWEYDIENNLWKEKVVFPGNVLEFNTATFVYDNKIHIIRSTNRATSKPMEIWSFDPNGLN